MQWYDALSKPSWTPEPSFIGLMWGILYPIIFTTFGFVLIQAIRRKIPPAVVIPFAVNLAANLAFSPIQFGLRNLWLAAVDVLVIWGSILWIVSVVWKHYRWVAIAQAPYFAWVTVATVLQLSITWMNR